MALVAIFALAMPAAAIAQNRQPPRTTIDVPKITYSEFTLPNGLRVLLHEDHSSPIVAAELWYNAGSKYDFEGRSGTAHLFEHMMDEGTLNMPTGVYKQAIQSVGGYYNAMVTEDIARFWTIVPSNQLETVLWLEAERMANLGPAIDTNRLNLEREAVRNEFRQRVQGNATLTARERIAQTLFAGGIYGMGLFYQGDLSSISIGDLRRFYDTYYVPNNAVLVLVGDLTPADARRKVEKHFSPIPRGKAVSAPPDPRPFHGETRLVVEHPQSVRGIWVVWRGAPSASPDRPALLALSSILTQRLNRVLIEERKVSNFISLLTNQSFDLAQAGVFQVAMTPNATAPGTVFEEVLDSVVASIKSDGVTEQEIHRWIAGFRMEMLSGMQTDSAKAARIGDATLTMKRPLGIYELTERGQRITPADVQAAARKYLTADRVVTSIIPPGKLDLISKPNLPYVKTP